jgi:hypothetical protein
MVLVVVLEENAIVSSVEFLEGSGGGASTVIGQFVGAEMTKGTEGQHGEAPSTPQWIPRDAIASPSPFRPVARSCVAVVGAVHYQLTHTHYHGMATVTVDARGRKRRRPPGHGDLRR